MAQLNVRLDDTTRDSFDALARARGISGSELIRELIDGALGRDDPDRPQGDLSPRSLSAVDRRQLAMLHEVLARLMVADGEDDSEWEAAYHRQMIDVLNCGYTAEYYKTFQMVRPEMTSRACALVHDILDMFTDLERSVSELGEEELGALGEHAEHALQFRGFDFNNSHEARLAAYAHYVVRDGRWEWMADHFDAQHENGNSHAPMLATYQRMLSAWRPISERKLRSIGGPKHYLFSADELREVLAAWPYPRE